MEFVVVGRPSIVFRMSDCPDSGRVLPFNDTGKISSARFHSIFNKRIEYYRKLTHFHKSLPLSLYTYFSISIRFVVCRLSRALCSSQQAGECRRANTENTRYSRPLCFSTIYGVAKMKIHSFTICSPKKNRHDYHYQDENTVELSATQSREQHVSAHCIRHSSSCNNK